MDLNRLLEHNRRVLVLQEKAASEEERRAFRQFVLDHSVSTTLRQIGSGSAEANGTFPEGQSSPKGD